MGLQHKTVDKLSEELSLPSSQLLGLFNRIVRKSIQFLNGIAEDFVESRMMVKERPNDDIRVDAENGKSMESELEAAAKVSSICQVVTAIYLSKL